MRFLRRNKKWIKLFFILVFASAFTVGAMPGGPDLDLNKIGIKYKKKLELRQGLDLKGGAHLVYNIDLSKTEEGKRGSALESVKKVVENRVNFFGVTEPIIAVSKSLDGTSRLAVDLPGVSNTNEAINLIGETAEMEFREQDETGSTFKSTGLRGGHLKNADVAFDENTKAPQISIEFNEEGKKLFAEITQRNIGKPLAIYLDESRISSPNVNEAIKEGKAVISGQFTVKEAKNLAVQLNAGALPVPLELVEQRIVGATLGEEALVKSIYAGFVGLMLIVIYMIYFYKLPGVLSSITLFIYTVFTLTVFKFFSVTLTLAGIAGFILSIGMAIDANILIFERMKEEIRSGKTLKLSFNNGFRRAWTSIRDSNVSSLITCIILWYGPAQIRGFALTLAIGILISMFTAITISKNLLGFIISFKFFNKLKLYGIKEEQV